MTPQPYLGYYRVDTVQEGDYRDDVRPYTNLAYVGGVDAGLTDTPPDQRKANLERIIKRLTKKRGFEIVLDLEIGAGRLGPKAAIKAARPYWPWVRSIVLGDEQLWSRAELMGHVLRAADLVDRHVGPGAQRPIGVSLNPEQILSQPTAYFAGLDFVNIWAYRSARDETPDQLFDRVQRMATQVSRPVYVTLEAYTRGEWTPRPHLMLAVAADLQSLPVPVNGVLAFAYGRDGGARDYPSVQGAMRTIGGYLGV